MASKSLAAYAGAALLFGCSNIFSPQLHHRQRPNLHSWPGHRRRPTTEALPSAEVQSLPSSRVDEAMLIPRLQTQSKSPSTSRQMAASPYPLTRGQPHPDPQHQHIPLPATSRAATSPSPTAPPRPTTPAWATSCYSEPGSTVKHVKWVWPDCLVGDGGQGKARKDTDRGVYNMRLSPSSCFLSI